MTEEERTEHIDVLDHMIRTGGGFARHLGHAWIRADSENRCRLYREFQDLYDHFRDDLALLRRNQRLARERAKRSVNATGAGS